MSKIDVEILNNIIVGRVEPHIYAFSTQTVPNYLKVGDTYRPIEIRLNEWRKYFPNLEKQFSDVAKADEEVFFRDFAVHIFLESIGKSRLQKDTINNLPYYSNEFFKEAKTEDVQNAIADIKNSHSQNDGRYQFYKLNESRVPLEYKWDRTEKFEPRPNQQEVIDKFKEAWKKGCTNLLMYAVMRFGKSFTSMCCATEMSAKLVVVVSAKADVKDEWKKTVESHTRFKDYVFLDSDSLQSDEYIISNTFKKSDENKIVLFLTLQDLQGKKIKNKHKEVFSNDIDLLLIDETHFGVRGEKYGKVLSDIGFKNKRQQNNELYQSKDTYYSEDLDEAIKVLNSKIRIHLSGTPYRILMGSEFKKEDIIAFYQFTDIIEEQTKWDAENINNDDIKEWDNPYYGFPQMVRFAFNPNESSIRKMEELKKSGVTYAFSALFKPQSITKDESQKYKKFIHDKEILNLLEVIDGSKEDNNLLGFLNYDRIKEGKMCRHIVCVLPYRASCDAFEELIKSNSDKFKNLCDYEIINIAGLEETYKDADVVKKKIKECESEDKKTLTLTVNRMLTGTTVEQWDTMLYFKDTASPQEYDQATFRLQNQYIKSYKDSNGEEVKYNMKPQTLLVDFDPNRMFSMQEQKSQIYNVNVENNGNERLRNRIKQELDISPIVFLNHNKIKRVEPSDILKAVSEYSSSKSVVDEATDVPIDFSLLHDKDIREEIEKQAEINSKGGLEIKPTKGKDEDNIDSPDVKSNDDNNEQQKGESVKDKDNEISNLRKKFATYYSRLLFFSFLINKNVRSVQDIIDSINEDEIAKRIAKNLGIDKRVLQLFKQKIDPFILSKLDYKIQNLNALANDNSLEPLARAETALKKFGRLSDSEIVTPSKIADEMVATLPEDSIANNAKILDIASKQGEFAIALFKRFNDPVKNNIYSITTSLVAYEFTRKIYEILGLPVANIFEDFNSYDLIGENKDNIIDKLDKMEFNIIVSNPPYQLAKESTSDNSIYHLFMDVAFKISEKVILITPARFLFNAGKAPKEWNNKILNDTHFRVIWYKSRSVDVFPNVDIMGGIAVTLRDKKQEFGKIGTFTSFPELNSILQKVVEHNDFTSINEIIYSQNKFSLTQLYKDFPHYKEIIGSDGKERRLTTSIFEQLDLFSENSPNHDSINILGLIKNIRTYRYIPSKYIESHENLHKYKVLVPKSNGSGALGEVLSTPLIGEPIIGNPQTGHTQSFISIGSFETLQEAEAAIKYVKSKFSRVMLGVLKVTQDNSREVWKFVPLQDFTNNSDIDWSNSVAEIDTQLYAKYGLTQDEITFIESMIKPME